ncbi:MAG: caspase family protein [Rhodoferax sp.]|nr:caspase family protein [Rhodoferax sp.]
MFHPLIDSRMLRHLLHCLLLLFLGVSLPSSAAERRVALVIGNASYAEKPLRNPVNDAELMQSTLRGLGFEVSLVRNADRRELLGGLREFEAKARNADIALFFYAGHGAQVSGTNYLIPLKAQIHGESDVPDEAVDANSVLRRIEDAKARVGLVILDACRDNPYAGASRSSYRGLARMSVPTGSIVAYATAPGDTADDGRGTNGVYTEQLTRHLSQAGLDLREVFDRTAVEVERLTNGKQKPREDVGLRGRIVLKSTSTPGPGTQVASLKPEPDPSYKPAQSDPEQEAWELAKKRDTVASYNAYLKAYPIGRYAGTARMALEGLQPSPAPPATVTAPQPQQPRPVQTTLGAHEDRFQESGVVITDTQTGLQWTKADNGSGINWNEAKSYCANKGGGWRLPSVNELQGIYDRSQSNPCGTSTCRTSRKFRLTDWWFWSNERDGSSEAFFVYLTDSNRFSSPVEARPNLRALCVRRP